MWGCHTLRCVAEEDVTPPESAVLCSVRVCVLCMCCVFCACVFGVLSVYLLRVRYVGVRFGEDVSRKTVFSKNRVQNH